MGALSIEQLYDEDVTVIEGTRYSNEFLRILGQEGLAPGPFVIESRKGGTVTMRTVSHWPEEPDTLRMLVQRATLLDRWRALWAPDHWLNRARVEVWTFDVLHEKDPEWPR